GETQSLVNDVVFAKGGSVSDLFTADHTFVNQGLAQFYGLGGANGDTFTAVPLNGQRDPGILAHGGLLTVQAGASASSPVQRGQLVRTRFFCQPVPPPPPNVPPLAPPQSARTTRQRYEQHLQPGCDTCHTLMDPIGFGFEGYDAFGR